MEAVVQFDYAAREPDELTLKKGDVITDVKPMPDGWMEGHKDGKKGMFPDTYVKIVHNSGGVVLRKKNARKCKVLFSYKPANRDELELNIDDVIEVLGEVEEGWWKGELRNEIGVFPSNYVTEISDVKSIIISRSDSKTSTGSLKKEESIKKEKSIVEPIKTADNNIEPNAPVLPPKPAKEVCVALFPYEAVNSDELSLAEGDIVTILSREVEDKGWWKGELKGRIGVFPDNFVQIMNQDELATKSEKTVSSPRSGTTASLRKVFQSQMENKPLGPVVSKKPALPPPPPTTKKPPTAKSSSTSSLSKTISGIKSMLNSEQNTTDKMKHINSEIGDSKQYGSIAVKRSESVGSMKKTSDSPDGSSMSRSIYHVTPESSPTSLVFTNHDNNSPELKSPDFDQIERTAMLSHPTASRAKAPRRRPPSAAFNVSTEEDPALDPPPTNGIPGVDKEKAPWVQELKMNQAKKSSIANSVIGGGRTRVMINPSTTTITSESSSETTTVTSRSGLTSVGLGGVVFKPPGYVPPLTTPEPVTVSTPTSPVAPISADFSLSTTSVDGNLISVLNEKVKQLESTVQLQNSLLDKLSTKLEVEMEKRIEIEKEMKKIMELVTRV
ncbi:SH3 domain-containing kinase-binding protein 1 [Acyrthosiphon pisum]|uniref:SH3 domain-containing protein n=2 Tax=Acyrthosiphon pisum TaxID=7029 RepID=A0A8R1W641_ACYPI|nr:SH3 domain-containing kinase-binding protein 1 [Acyrthosiphon pisum]|eukprot:XP_001951086.1 PREDICTED: SH3 domain-containing kinase-binding protein 1 [Acyrthosiphon pisum]